MAEIERCVGKTCDAAVKVAFSTPSVKKLVKASKLLIAIPPLVTNLPCLDLRVEERSLFGQFKYNFYWNAVVRNSGIPDNVRISSFDPAASYGIPALPEIYAISASSVSGLHGVQYGSSFPIDNDKVRTDLLTRSPRSPSSTAFRLLARSQSSSVSTTTVPMS